MVALINNYVKYIPLLGLIIWYTYHRSRNSQYYFNVSDYVYHISYTVITQILIIIYLWQH